MDSDKFRIFSISSEESFNAISIEIFHFQYENNKIYREYANAIHTNINKIKHFKQIPFLPIELFKTQEIKSGSFEPEATFESSGTTGSIKSRHFIRDLKLYEESFIRGFEYFYGKPEDYCILALLPSYIENENSSLIYMVTKLIELSKHKDSGFYLNEFKKLADVLNILSAKNQKTILIGVSYALLDFAEHKMHRDVTCNVSTNNLIVMETGGMKGKREMIKEELHKILCEAFVVQKIHSEYGMTELLSQAYSFGEGLFKCPPWMRVLVRDMNDPFTILEAGKTGGLNVIDLANRYSCSFIETKDICRIHQNKVEFEVAGRMDNSDIRGCNQLIIGN